MRLRAQLSQEEVDIGNCEYVPQHLSLGGHWGNQFSVLLRSLQPTPTPMRTREEAQVQDLEGVVASCLQAVEGRGFINYFGMQRLGFDLLGPRIGLALLHEDIVSLRTIHVCSEAGMAVLIL